MQLQTRHRSMKCCCADCHRWLPFAAAQTIAHHFFPCRIVILSTAWDFHRTHDQPSRELLFFSFYFATTATAYSSRMRCTRNKCIYCFTKRLCSEKLRDTLVREERTRVRNRNKTQYKLIGILTRLRWDKNGRNMMVRRCHSDTHCDNGFFAQEIYIWSFLSKFLMNTKKLKFTRNRDFYNKKSNRRSRKCKKLLERMSK